MNFIDAKYAGMYLYAGAPSVQSHQRNETTRTRGPPLPLWDFRYAQYPVFTQKEREVETHGPRNPVELQVASPSKQPRAAKPSFNPTLLASNICPNTTNQKPNFQIQSPQKDQHLNTLSPNQQRDFQEVRVNPKASVVFAGLSALPTAIPSLDQEYNKKVLEHRKTGRDYIDQSFPPNELSLMGTDKEMALSFSHWKQFVWKKPEEFLNHEHFDIVVGEIEPADIKQGELGDCYFLSTIASLAESPERIMKVMFIPDDCGQTNGLYCVKMCIRGIWQNVYLDSFFPCEKYSGPVFTKGNGNELWVLLLEKAWAKVHGSYLRIESGLTRECLHDLTGAPTKVLWSDDKDLWDEIVEGEKRNWAMTCGSGGSEIGMTQSAMERQGLHPDHAYSLLAALEIHDGRSLVRLVRLRNPWGKGEWLGDWSDKSPKWNSSTKAQVVEKLGQGSVSDKDDGIFFMDFRDFTKYFPDIQICMVEDSYHYSAIEASTWHNHSVKFSFVVRSPGEYFLTISQDSKRMFARNSDYEYSDCMMVLAKWENGKIYYVGGKYGKDREVWMLAQLQPSSYVVHVKGNWFQKNKRTFGFSVYGPGKLKVVQEPQNIHKKFLRCVLLGKAKESRSKWLERAEEKLYSMQEMTPEGILYFFFKNESQFAYEVEMNFTELKNLKLFKPFKGSKVILRVNPGHEEIILLKKTGIGISYNYKLSIQRV